MKQSDLEKMTERAEYKGFGYLGHPNRTRETDLQLHRATIAAELSADEVFLWANSKCARLFMDAYDPTFFDALSFYLALKADLPWLKAEQRK